MSNILHLVTAFKRNSNDVITPWMVDLLAEQASGNNVFVLTSAYRRINKKQIFNNIKILRFSYAPSNLQKMSHDFTMNDFLKKNPLYFLLLPLFFICGTIKLVEIVNKYDIDIVNIHWPFPLSLMTVPIRYLKKIKIVNIWYGAEMKIIGKKTNKIKDIFRSIVKAADINIAISTHTANILKKIIGEVDTVIIPYGVIVPKKQEYKKKKYILFVGRLVERKGVEYLIKAMKTVKKEYILKIVGSGPIINKLREIVKFEQLSNRVEFLGKVNNEKLVELYQDASVFVLPAIYDSKGDTEGLGMVLVEAMCYNTPVIATGIGGITDIIIDKETGLFSKEKNCYDIAEKINLILSDNKLEERLTDNAYNYIVDRFSIKNINKKFQDVYEKIYK